MKTAILSTIALLMIFSMAPAAGPDAGEDYDFDFDNFDIEFDHDFDNCHYFHDNDVNLDVKDNGDVIITCDKRRYKSDEVKITNDYRLYVNGDRVDLNNHQQELVEVFYHKAIALNEETKIIVEEGARIGLEGARIGANAVSGVFQMFLLDFDEDEFEDRIEGRAEDLEEMADKLEEKAEHLEDLADELEDMHDDLDEEISELNELRWF